MYGLFLSLAVVIGAVFGAASLRPFGIGWRVCGTLLASGAGTAVIGAKAFSAFERGGLVWWDPWWELVHGYRYPGAILALVSVAPLLRRLLHGRLRLVQLADVLAPTVALSMSVVRVGCFAAGCCHGTPSALPWSVRFPPATPAFLSHVERGWIDASASSSVSVHPLQVYFCATSLALALLLIRFRRKQARDGQTFFLFLLIDGILKLGFEQLRLDSQPPLALAAAVFATVGAVGVASSGDAWRRRGAFAGSHRV